MTCTDFGCCLLDFHKRCSLSRVSFFSTPVNHQWCFLLLAPGYMIVLAIVGFDFDWRDSRAYLRPFDRSDKFFQCFWVCIYELVNCVVDTSRVATGVPSGVLVCQTLLRPYNYSFRSGIVISFGFTFYNSHSRWKLFKPSMKLVTTVCSTNADDCITRLGHCTSLTRKSCSALSRLLPCCFHPP